MCLITVRGGISCAEYGPMCKVCSMACVCVATTTTNSSSSIALVYCRYPLFSHRLTHFPPLFLFPVSACVPEVFALSAFFVLFLGNIPHSGIIQKYKGKEIKKTKNKIHCFRTQKQVNSLPETLAPPPPPPYFLWQQVCPQQQQQKKITPLFTSSKVPSSSSQ